jgi:hypothetical protein
MSIDGEKHTINEHSRSSENCLSQVNAEFRRLAGQSEVSPRTAKVCVKHSPSPM